MLLGRIWRGPRQAFYDQTQTEVCLQNYIFSHQLLLGCEFYMPDVTKKSLKEVGFCGPNTIHDIVIRCCRNCYYLKYRILGLSFINKIFIYGSKNQKLVWSV